MNIAYHAPTRLIFGAGSVAQAARLVATLGDRLLLVSGQSAMDSAGVTGRMIDDLSKQRVLVHRFTVSQHGPTTADVDHGVELCRRNHINIVLAIGGGSSLDGGKAIAGVASVNASAEDVLYGRAEITSHALPIVCIPSTAGTGSELNRSAIITDPKTPFKDGIRSDHIFPRYAIVDSELTWTLPATTTAQTGFDVLAHAVESYLSPKATPFCDRLALQAIDSVWRWLQIAISDPHNRLARDRMALASTSMGINLSCVGTCFPHRADKSLCAMRPEITHGQSVAYFYRYWLEMCRDAAERRLTEIAAVLLPDSGTLSTAEAARSCCNEILQLIDGLGLGTSLKDAGITTADVPQLVQGVAGDLKANPVPLEREELPNLFHEILNGSQS